MVIQHNLPSMFSQRQLGITTGIKKKSTEKLSSGYRINRAADDAAGLAISEKMRRQIRGMTQNLDNIQEGVSFCQIADGYLQEVHEMIQRVNELGVKGATDTLTSDDRSYIDMEVQDIKEEMQRIFNVASYNEMLIFRVPYSPTVMLNQEPYDTQLFYGSQGQIGGLEFNNIRYNIDELNAKGMNLDANGVALTDNDAQFALYDGELVHLRLSQGQSLEDVRRVYHWSADNNGVYINEQLASTWADLGISGSGHDAGIHTFTYRSMDVSFTVPEGDKIPEMILGLNGDGITPSATWDLSVSGVTTRNVMDFLSSVTLSANEGNEGYFDHDFVLRVSPTGLSMMDRTDGSGTSQVSNWSSFSNVGDPIAHDVTHSNFPIVDWGLDIDGNDASQITFDTEAVYNYTSKDSKLPVSFDFKLADVSSLADVMASANNTAFTNEISCPASFSYRGSDDEHRTTDGTALTIYNVRLTENNNDAYRLQRDYGRNFDTNAALSGQITWRSQYVDGSETDHTDPVSGQVTEIGRTTSSDAPADFYYHDADTDTYWKYDETKTTTEIQSRKQAIYKWTKDYDVIYDGNLGTADMKDDVERITVGYTQTKSGSFTTTVVNYDYSNAVQITDPQEIQDLIDSGVEFKDSFKDNPDPVEVVGDDATDITEMDDGLISKMHTFVAEGESDDDNYGFAFEHTITYNKIINGTGGQSNLNLSFIGPATRAFVPLSHTNTIAEHDFMNVKVNPPEKNLVIQASPDSEIVEQIELDWNALNLNILGMAGTNTLTASAAKAAIEQAKEALKVVSEERGKFGAMQNRCEHAYKEVANARENTQHSESIIRDTDMAAEMVRLSNHNILEQAGQSMLAQANQTNQGVLSLLQ